MTRGNKTFRQITHKCSLLFDMEVKERMRILAVLMSLISAVSVTIASDSFKKEICNELYTSKTDYIATTGYNADGDLVDTYIPVDVIACTGNSDIKVVFRNSEPKYSSYREYSKVCVNLQTDVRYNYSVWRLFLWQEKKTAHKKQQ